jgi:hypothetical protein
MKHENQEDFDLAQSWLRLLLGHYGRVISYESKVFKPEAERISHLRTMEFHLSETYRNLTVDNTVGIEIVLNSYEDDVEQILEKFTPSSDEDPF